jgi:hypothetical protein
MGVLLRRHRAVKVFGSRAVLEEEITAEEGDF